ncbi:hypothetical protein BaRGS_00035744 [Batillaria attramentaria]|uniref:Major facilitator superfamily (MFS) profile domain-containing protein n=1 Tax=Batillaria attramentaria TaxID=370345 RepID=A0ABD0JDN9_9CAEN
MPERLGGSETYDDSTVQKTKADQASAAQGSNCLDAPHLVGESESLLKDGAPAGPSMEDRGWAWMVVLGCFLAHVITGGLERSDGVFFLKLTSRYDESAQMTAWAGALSGTVMLSMGPVAGALCNRYSARASVMAGAVLYTLGLVFSGLAPSLPILIVCFGVVQGIGRGLSYAPGLIIVGMYFNRRRGLGVGLSTAGVGAGTFLLPPFVELIFETYGFSGAFLILGGLACNVFLVAMLYRPVFMHRQIVLRHRQKQRLSKHVELTVESDSSCREELLKKRTGVGNSLTNSHTCTSKTLSGDTPTSLNDCTHAKDEKTSEALVSTNQHQPGRCDLCRSQRNFELNAESTSVSSLRRHCQHTTDLEDQTFTSRGKLVLPSCLRSVLATCFPAEKRSTGTQRRKIMELSLLREPVFLFYCFSICLYTASLKSSLVFLPALVKSRGVSEIHAAYLLSISGILDTIGRVTSGVVLGLRPLQRLRSVFFNAFVFLLCALLFVVPSLSSFPEFVAVFGMFGMLTGAYVCQKSVILVDMLGQGKLGSSFGLLIFFQGLGNCVGPPLSGLLKDVFGQYDEVFYLSGGMLATAGCLMVISNIFHRRRVRRQAISMTAQ